MPRAIHVRLDAEAEAALGVLRAEGMNDSQAVRRALTEARARRRQRTALREEARRLAADPADRAELAALRVELDELTPEWPPD
jgi:Arc/MetJ-type ribon-helix-helix transcriptional regulator